MVHQYPDRWRELMKYEHRLQDVAYVVYEKANQHPQVTAVTVAAAAGGVFPAIGALKAGTFAFMAPHIVQWGMNVLVDTGENAMAHKVHQWAEASRAKKRSRVPLVRAPVSVDSALARAESGQVSLLPTTHASPERDIGGEQLDDVQEVFNDLGLRCNGAIDTALNHRQEGQPSWAERFSQNFTFSTMQGLYEANKPVLIKARNYGGGALVLGISGVILYKYFIKPALERRAEEAKREGRAKRRQQKKAVQLPIKSAEEPKDAEAAQSAEVPPQPVAC
jgi:hypothetical protein